MRTPRAPSRSPGTNSTAIHEKSTDDSVSRCGSSKDSSDHHLQCNQITDNNAVKASPSLQSDAVGTFLCTKFVNVDEFLARAEISSISAAILTPAPIFVLYMLLA